MANDTAKFFIPRHHIQVSTSRSGGAGGQHVNKVETKVELRFSTIDCEWIPTEVLNRLKSKYPTRISKDGDFILTCDESRSQFQNTELAFKKLQEIIVSCLKAPKKRLRTKPTRSSKEKRLESKKYLSSRKKQRSQKNWD